MGKGAPGGVAGGAAREWEGGRGVQAKPGAGGAPAPPGAGP